MDALKDLFTVLAALIGVVTAVLTAYAKFLDIRERKKQQQPVLQSVATPVPDEGVLTVVPVEDAPIRVSADPRVATLVKGPAIGIIAAGVFGLLCNLAMAGYGYVDEFITPLSAKPGQQRNVVSSASTLQPATEGVSDRAGMVITIAMFLALAIASAAAIWAGINMLCMRSYWFSVAGSIAVMPGAFFCCMLGVPVGIWSLAVLFRPEVRSSFM